jgi:hypothetical protein
MSTEYERTTTSWNGLRRGGPRPWRPSDGLVWTEWQEENTYLWPNLVAPPLPQTPLSFGRRHVNNKLQCLLLLVTGHYIQLRLEEEISTPAWHPWGRCLRRLAPVTTNLPLLRCMRFEATRDCTFIHALQESLMPIVNRGMSHATAGLCIPCLRHPTPA